MSCFIFHFQLLYDGCTRKNWFRFIRDGAGVFLWAFGTSQYRLTPEVVRQSIPDTAHYARLETGPAAPAGQAIPVELRLCRDVKEAINRVNDEFKAKGQWDRVIYNDYTLWTKTPAVAFWSAPISKFLIAFCF
jgi:hypothetical protein